jgi:hypothetical protein
MTLTPDDLRNDDSVTGFKHVYSARDASWPARGGKPFQATAYFPWSGDGVRRRWKGPRRATALEAVQDYCDYVNGNPVAAQPNRMRRAIAKAASLFTQPPLDDAAKAERDRVWAEAQAYVYLIGEEWLNQAACAYVKVGWSFDPANRLEQLQAGNPRRLVLMGTLTPAELGRSAAEALEVSIHEAHARRRVLGEWFWADPDLLRRFGVER